MRRAAPRNDATRRAAEPVGHLRTAADRPMESDVDLERNLVRRMSAAVAAAAMAAMALAGAVPAPAAHADGSRLPLPAAKTFPGARYAANPGNPLAGGGWAVNNGFWENGHGLYTDYLRASGATRAYLGREALQPSALWLTGTNSFVRTKVSDYLRTVNPTRDRSRLVTVAVFGLWPRGEGARHTPMTAAEQTHYRRWIRRVSAGIGGSRVLIALEPDLAITANPASADGVRDPQVRQGLTAYAARWFHDHNPRAVVYLDAGASDWLSPAQAAALLVRSGVQFARGFSLDVTHYTPTADNVVHGSEVVQELARRGLPGKHFVIDTADNGRGYTWSQWAQRFGAGGYDDSRRCPDTQATLCNALGVPPTWRVTDPAYVSALGLTAAEVRSATQDVDAYVWLTRPWMRNQASPYQRGKALAAARSTPFAGLF